VDHGSVYNQKICLKKKIIIIRTSQRLEKDESKNIHIIIISEILWQFQKREDYGVIPGWVQLTEHALIADDGKTIQVKWHEKGGA